MFASNFILVVVACVMPFMFAVAAFMLPIKTHPVVETLPVAKTHQVVETLPVAKTHQAVETLPVAKVSKKAKYNFVMADPKDYDDDSTDDIDLESFVSLVKVFPKGTYTLPPQSGNRNVVNSFNN